MRTFTVFALAASLMATISGVTLAQGTTTTPSAKPAHHGLLGFLHRPKPGTTAAPTGSHMRPMDGNHMRPMTGMRTPMSGQIIGNKNTHVYHMPGDKGALPDPKNRVYFRTEAQAAAAGYHRAGATHAGMKPASHGAMHHTMHSMMPGAKH